MGVLREDIDNILKQDINWDKLRKSNVLITGAGGMLGSYMMKTIAQIMRLKILRCMHVMFCLLI